MGSNILIWKIIINGLVCVFLISFSLDDCKKGKTKEGRTEGNEIKVRIEMDRRV